MNSFNSSQEMSVKGSFSFRNNKFFQTQIQDGIRLRMDRIGMAVARVYFIKEENIEVPIPHGFRIIDHSNGDILVNPIIGRQEYFIGWTDNYSFIYNNNVVMTLINQRQWVIQCHQESSFESLDSCN